MRTKWLIFAILVIPGFILIGCGSAAEAPRPTFEPTNTFDVSMRVTDEVVSVKADEDGNPVDEVAVAATATNTPEPPTATPEPTETPIPPTATSEPPTATPEPTEAPTEVALAGDPANGENLFLQNGCTGCHMVNTDAVGAGPGLLGLGENAATRVDGLSAEEYLYESIVNPSAYVVEGYVDGVMPQTFGSLPESDLQDLVAYLAGL